MSYFVWLLGLSGFFVLVERIRPRDPNQTFIRPQLLTDAFYLIFNGHFIGVMVASAAEPILIWLDGGLMSMNLHDVVYRSWARNWSFGVQLVVAFVAVDFVHWNIHRLLHRVPFLWRIHQVHHSARVLDWWASLRFHWGEVVVYKVLTYPALALLGFDGEVLFALAVLATAIGHFNHANLDIDLGPLRYVLNSPAMHVWHHVHSEAGPTNRNFGINLSVWDWLFRTAHLPSHPPARLGFEGIETFPDSAPAQLVHPLPVSEWLRRAQTTSVEG